MFRLKPRIRRKPRPEVWRKGRPRRSRSVNLPMRDTWKLPGSIRALERATAERVGAKLGPVLAEALYGRDLGRRLHGLKGKTTSPKFCPGFAPEGRRRVAWGEAPGQEVSLSP